MKVFQFREDIERLCPPGMLELPTDVTWLPNGNVLIADAGSELGLGSEIIEVDRLGRVVWVYGGDLLFAHSCKPTSWGGILIADTTNNRVLEVNREKKIIWTSEDWMIGTGQLDDGTRFWYPNDAEETPEGTILASDRNNNRAIEFTRSGRVVWKYENLHHPHNADRLPNGNTMIADSSGNRVIEVNKKGEIVWQYGDGTAEMLGWPRDADRLPNGNTLVGDSRNDRILEVDPAGKVVWEFKSPVRLSPYEADPLPNGHILVSDQARHRVFELDQAGNIIWCFRNHYLVDPLPAELVNGDFEEEAYAGAGRPLGWMPNSRQCESGRLSFTWEGQVAKQGGRSAAIEYEGVGGIFWSQTIQAKGDRPYHVSGYIKTEGLEGEAQIQFVPLDRDQSLLMARLASGQAISGTTDWTLTSFEARTPAEATSIGVRLSISGRGKAWFDVVECYEIPWM